MYNEYWYHYLQPNVHFIRTNFPSKVELPEGIDRIAASGAKLAADLLHPDNVDLYFVLLWQTYAKLQRFTPIKENLTGFSEVLRGTGSHVEIRCSELKDSIRV